MFENTSPTLLDTRDMFRIRFWYQKYIFRMKNTIFFLLKLQGKMTNFVRSSLYRYPSVFYRGSCEKIEKRSNKFFSKIRRFLTPNRILMFENTSPTLLDTQDVFRIRFWYQKRILGMKIRFFGFFGFFFLGVVFRKISVRWGPPPRGGRGGRLIRLHPVPKTSLHT